MAKPSSQVFVREATGLVRSAGLFDMLVLNYAETGASFSLWLAFVYGSFWYAFPGVDFIGALVTSGVLSIIFIAFPYALMSTVMPRSGGDYVYNSRILSPALAFADNFVLAMMLAFFVAFGAYWAAGLGVATLFTTIGYYLGNTGLVGIGTAISTTNNLFILATVFVIIFVLLVLPAIKTFLRIIDGMFILGTIGMLVGLAVLAMTPQTVFIPKFNTFMQLFTSDPDYYHTVITTAKNAGLTYMTSPFASYPAIAVGASATIWGYFSSFVGGEIKDARKTQLLSMPLSIVLLVVEAGMLYWLNMNSVGYDFQVSINYLWWTANPSLALPLWPFFNLWASIASNNILVVALIGIGFLALGMMYLPLNILVMTRMIFSWSFDRIFPEKLASVHDRTHSPVWAILLSGIISEAFLVMFAYTPYLTGLTATLAYYVAVIIGSISMIILPFRRKDLFDASPISKYKIGKLPLITLLGAGGAIYMAYSSYVFLTDAAIGSNSPIGLGTVFGMGVFALVIYYIARTYRRKQGIDMKIIFQQIPPD